MALAYPGFFRGLVIDAGRINDSEKNVGTCKKMGAKKVVIISGNSDTTDTPEMMRSHLLFRQAGVPVEIVTFKGGHAVAPSYIWSQAIRNIN